MGIPSRNECLELLLRVRMQAHIQKHSFMVAGIALYLGRRLIESGLDLDLEMVEAGALLHDIAKPHSIATGERHEEIGASMLLQWGYKRIAPIVQEHVSMDHPRATGPITESLLVNYSDKRVKHEEIVTLEERFRDLIERYVRTEFQRDLLNRRLSLYHIVEERIFSNLSVSPIETELIELPLPPQYLQEGDSNGHEREETDGRPVVGR